MYRTPTITCDSQERRRGSARRSASRGRTGGADRPFSDQPERRSTDGDPLGQPTRRLGARLIICNCTRSVRRSAGVPRKDTRGDRFAPGQTFSDGNLCAWVDGRMVARSCVADRGTCNEARVRLCVHLRARAFSCSPTDGYHHATNHSCARARARTHAHARAHAHAHAHAHSHRLQVAVGVPDMAVTCSRAHLDGSASCVTAPLGPLCFLAMSEAEPMDAPARSAIFVPGPSRTNCQRPLIGGCVHLRPDVGAATHSTSSESHTQPVEVACDPRS